MVAELGQGLFTMVFNGPAIFVCEIFKRTARLGDPCIKGGNLSIEIHTVTLNLRENRRSLQPACD